MLMEKLQLGGLLIISTILLAVAPILVRYSKVNRESRYSSYAVNVMIELCKVCASLGIYLFYNRNSINFMKPPTNWWGSVKSFLFFGFPALLYVIDNNIFFKVMTMINPATFHLFNNIKIFIIAILARIFLKKQLNSIQWACLVLLFTGIFVSELDVPAHSSDHLSSVVGLPISLPPTPIAPRPDNKDEQIYHLENLDAFGLVCVIATCSSFANVSLEYMYKKVGEDLFLQILQLHFFGLLFNLILFFLAPILGLASSSTLSFFEGFDLYVWLIVLFNSLTGLSVSFVLKYAGNITNVWIHTASLLVTSTSCYFLFANPITRSFICGSVIVTLCAYIYYSAEGINFKSSEPSSGESPRLPYEMVPLPITDRQWNESATTVPDSPKVKNQKSEMERTKERKAPSYRRISNK